MEVVVYTSGVFDLFHAGHIEALTKARSLGTKLIVGVLSDEDTAIYKRRPIIPYQQRFRIIESLAFVDKVVWGPKSETHAFYRALEVDVHCQGDQLDGFYEVAKQLGILKIVGRSELNETSRIINEIKSRDF